MICNSSWCSYFYTNPNTSVNIVPQGFGDRWVLCGIIWNRQVASCRYLAGAPMYSPRVSLPSSSLLCHHNICLCDIFLSKQWYTSKTQRRPYIPIVYYMSITHLIFFTVSRFHKKQWFWNQKTSILHLNRKFLHIFLAECLLWQSRYWPFADATSVSIAAQCPPAR